MKRKNVCLMLSVLILLSCVVGDDYDVPVINEVEPDLEGSVKVSFKTALEAYQYGGSDFVTDDYIEAFVVSSDREGNIYKSIYVQDLEESPESALRIDVDMANTYLKYEVGRKIYIKLKGLAIDRVNGVLVLGVKSSSGFSRIPGFMVQEKVLRSLELKEIKPVEVELVALDELDIPIGVLVLLDKVQFDDQELGESYAYSGNNYSANRVLRRCGGIEKIILRNSGYASFKSHPLPEGSGAVTAILTQYNSTKQLLIRSVEDVQLDEERCD